MKSYHIPVAQWSVQDVQEWLTDIGLGKLNEAIEHNAGALSAGLSIFKLEKTYTNHVVLLLQSAAVI